MLNKPDLKVLGFPNIIPIDLRRVNNVKCVHGSKTKNPAVFDWVLVGAEGPDASGRTQKPFT